MGALKNMPLFESKGGDVTDNRFIDYIDKKYPGQDVVLHLGWAWYLAKWSDACGCHRVTPLFQEDADLDEIRPVLLLEAYNSGLVIQREQRVSLR